MFNQFKIPLYNQGLVRKTQIENRRVFLWGFYPPGQSFFFFFYCMIVFSVGTARNLVGGRTQNVSLSEEDVELTLKTFVHVRCEVMQIKINATTRIVNTLKLEVYKSLYIADCRISKFSVLQQYVTIP